MIAALAILQRIWPYLVAVAIVLAALFGAYMHGVTTTSDKYEAQISAEHEANAKAVALLQAQVRAKEQAAAENQAAIENSYLQGQTDAKSKTDGVIADLRAGNIRLRSDIAAAVCAAGGVPSASTSTGQCDAASTAGLRNRDAAFLVRFAARAQSVSRQLSAAQAIIAQDRRVCNGKAGAP